MTAMTDVTVEAIEAIINPLNTKHAGDIVTSMQITKALKCDGHFMVIITPKRSRIDVGIFYIWDLPYERRLNGIENLYGLDLIDQAYLALVYAGYSIDMWSEATIRCVFVDANEQEIEHFIAHEHSIADEQWVTERYQD